MGVAKRLTDDASAPLDPDAAAHGINTSEAAGGLDALRLRSISGSRRLNPPSATARCERGSGSCGSTLDASVGPAAVARAGGAVGFGRDQGQVEPELLVQGTD